MRNITDELANKQNFAILFTTQRNDNGLLLFYVCIKIDCKKNIE